MREFAARLLSVARFAGAWSRKPSLFEARALKDGAGNRVAKAAVKQFDYLRDDLRTSLRSHYDDLLGGKVSPEKALDKMTGEIRSAWRKSYETGKARMLGKVVPLDANDWAYLRRATEAEAGFLKNFIKDFKAHNGVAPVGKMDFARRLDLYPDGIKAAHWDAWTEYCESDTEIFWQLGPAEHCADCISLASMNPWTPFNLCCTPGSGDTACLGRCMCSLYYRIVRKKRRDQPTRPGKISDTWSLPTPPRGLSLPTAEQRLASESLRQEMNYWRRAAQDAAALGDDAAEAEALRMRKKVNAELIDFTKKNKVWSPPAFSVDEVLAGNVLDESLVSDLIEIGLDGQTMAGMHASTFKEVTGSILRDSKVVSLRVAKALKAKQ